MTLARTKIFWAFLLGVGLLRLVTLGTYPLLDTTEARYGEIARIMVDTGNWLVPQIDYGMPFWGKPPLSFWASALSIELFHNSEFFLRLPHLLAAIGVLLLVWRLALAQGFTRTQANASMAIVATNIGFLITAGSVMTDMMLCLSMTLAMAGFWRGWHGELRYVYVMYAGLGIGLLAKGPLIVVLVGLALFPWLVATCGIKSMWIEVYRRLKPISGLLLMLLIALPWYMLMERASPGFLRYFIVGEHFQRFLDSGWQGDLYGSGHAKPRGTIWLYWALFALPWSAVLLLAAFRARGEFLGLVHKPLTLFLLLWMCSPLLLFTLAGNILPAYIVPGLPAVGLLVMQAFGDETSSRGRYLLLVGPVLLLILCIYLGLFAGEEYSDKGLLAAGVDSQDDLFYFHERPYSAQYYSGGRARITDSFPTGTRFYLVIEKDRRLGEIGKYCELRSSNERRNLYFCRREPPA